MSEYQTYKDDEKKVQSMYSSYDEERRLNTTKASSVEFMTTMHYLEKYLKEGDSILDIGAGTGQYSFALAHKGYKVNAVDTTAAGDTFCGALAVACSQRGLDREALEFANVAAAIAVTRMGAQPSIPTLEEVGRFRLEREISLSFNL